jgi:hypothetical protein
MFVRPYEFQCQGDEDHTATGLTSVNHFDAKLGKGERERLLYLESGPNRILDRTVKTEELLKGAFGTLYSTKTCFYESPLTRGYSSVSVGAGYNDIATEIPIELPKDPETLPPLTSISVVRIFRDLPEYIVVVANYEVDGKMGGLQVSGAKGGNGDPLFHGGSYVVPYPTGEPSRLIKKYGLPDLVDIQEYLRSSRLLLPPVAFQQEITIVDLHYGYDKLIRQDLLKDGVLTSSRFLQPSVTPEENILDPLCETRFRQQRTAGIRTVF